MNKPHIHLPVAILAGGLATRLRPVSETIPKALVPVAGKPFVDHQLALLASQGVKRVVFGLGHLGEMVEAHLGREAWGMEIGYCYDGPKLLGTAGALRRAVPQLGERFFVLYGDSYLPVDYSAVEARFLACGKLGLMTVFRNEGRWDTSNVEFANGRVLAYDKSRRTLAMHHIDYGLCVFRMEAFAGTSETEASDLASVMQGLLAKGEMAAYEVGERFYEVGTFSGIEELEGYLLRTARAEGAFPSEE